MNNFAFLYIYVRYQFKKFAIHLSFLVLNLSTIAPILGQDYQDNTVKDDIKHKISLRHDNDFLTFSDRYYTSGLFLSYNRLLDNVVFKSGQEQFSIAFVQQIYTPSKLNTTNLAEMDRPYAGYIEVNTGWSYVKDNYGFETNFILGLVGKVSGSGDFHRWYHNALAIPKPPTWANELTNKVHANLYASYTHEWQLSPNNFSVYLAVKPKLALGTKDIYAQPEFIAHFGRRQAMTSSMAYNSIGSTEMEVFFTLRVGYRFVAHNALLEGHVFADNSVFLVSSENRFFYGGFDIKHRSGRNDYWFGYRFNTAETIQTKLHKYLILSYARSF